MEKDSSNLGFIIKVFLAIIFATILIPIIMDASEYRVGDAAKNQVYEDVYTTSAMNFSAGKSSASTLNVTRWGQTWLNFTTDQAIQAADSKEFSDTEWSIVTTVRFDTGTDPSKNYTIWSKKDDGTNPEMLLYHEGDSGLLYFALQSNETVMGENCSYNIGISINSTGNINKFITVTVATDAANITFFENTTSTAVGDLLRCSSNITRGAFVIGNFSGTTNYNALIGAIDDLQAYNSTLIADNMSIIGVGQDVLNSSLVTRFKFNENSGTTAYDTVKANNAVITGAVYDNNQVPKFFDADEYSVDGATNQLTLVGTYWDYQYIIWAFDYDLTTGMGAGVQVVLTLVAVLFAIGVIIYGYIWVKNNIEGL